MLSVELISNHGILLHFLRIGILSHCLGIKDAGKELILNDDDNPANSICRVDG